ncbi:YafY family transcriptional regulator [Enterococcus hulanensis]|uniref:helix-turn-helix transcriptional regulator n=1 Tax=Enterococcus hulanensis TaxID=2559929 RepID=UPI001A8FAFE2|nr:YafY family protein [Enterococcus hulanensis]MBO0457620.1 YafY family transcriptional regulator [Enterococcus hulanensis]
MKVDRLVSIIMVLLDKKRIGAQELAEMFEVSPRTIYRDIDSISMAGIPIRSTSGVGGGFEIMENYKLDKKVFSTTEISTLLMGLSSLSNVMRGDELVNALAKVKSFIPADQAKDIDVKMNQIHIELTPWMGNQNIQPFLELIKTALQENKLLAFDYVSHRGNKTARIVEPYQLVLKGNHWYVQAYCQQRSDFRLFKLARMSRLKLQDEDFTPRAFQKPQLEFSDILTTLQTEITLRIHRSVMDQVLDYCAFEHFTPEDEDHYIVRFPFIENDYHYNILFSFGNKCECLAPPHVREEMQRKVREIAELYD